jgi:hypothetical protein
MMSPSNKNGGVGRKIKNADILLECICEKLSPPPTRGTSRNMTVGVISKQRQETEFFKTRARNFLLRSRLTF